MSGRWSRRLTRPTSQGLLDALPGHAAVIDREGVIIAVNRAWTGFATANGGSAPATGVGSSYAAVCERSAALGSPEAARVGVALKSVLRGDSTAFSTTYPCPSPDVARWFVLRITPLGGRDAMVLVVHEDVTAQRALELNLERRASQDALTGLGNHSVLIRALLLALAPGSRLSGHEGVGLVYVDLDDFKPVNDTHGHGTGDAVLRSVALRLLTLSRTGDTVARLGGDEFALCVPAISADGLAALTDRISRQLDLEHVVRDLELRVRASVGCHLATPGDDVADVMDRADEAMYRVKHRRRGELDVVAVRDEQGLT